MGNVAHENGIHEVNGRFIGTYHQSRNRAIYVTAQSAADASAMLDAIIATFRIPESSDSAIPAGDNHRISPVQSRRSRRECNL